MSRFRKAVGGAALLAAVAAVLIAYVPTASAASTTCPSGGTPPPGSTITGGLDVDGACSLDGVTVRGGITVGSAAKYPGLFLNASTVTGGLVSNGGEVDIGYDFDAEGVTFSHNTITGGITLNNPAGFDIFGATIRGGFHFNTGFPSCSPPFPSPCVYAGLFCNNVIYGDTRLDTVYQGVVAIGDPEPDETCGGAGLGGNTFHGSLSLINSNYLILPPFIPPGAPVESNEIEGNTVEGSLRVIGSTAEVYGNTVGGSLFCSNDTVILRPLGLDPSGNTVNGQNTCT